MSLNALNVHQGPSRIFMNITNPATGNPPTASAHTAGVPTPGVEVGFTTGDTIFRRPKETGFITAEQATGPIGAYLLSEGVELEFSALEQVYTTLQAAFDNTGSAHPAGMMIFWGGGSAYPIRTQSIFLSSLRPNQAGKYETMTIYRAYSVQGVEKMYRKSGATEMKMIMRGLFDTSRAIGDQLYQHVIEE